MFRFIRRLFGNDVTTADSRGDDDTELVVHRSSRAHKPCVSDTYFDTMSRMQAAVSNRNYEGAARLVCENLQYIPDWVKETRRDYGSFDIGSIPALQQGGTVLALVGDEEGLARMHETVVSVPELEPWADAVKRHQHDCRLFKAIQQVVVAQPNRGGPHRLDHLAAFLRWTPQLLLPPVREILRGGEPEGKVPLRMFFQASVHLLRRRPSVRRVRSLAVV